MSKDNQAVEQPPKWSDPNKTFADNVTVESVVIADRERYDPLAPRWNYESRYMTDRYRLTSGHI